MTDKPEQPDDTTKALRALEYSAVYHCDTSIEVNVKIVAARIAELEEALRDAQPFVQFTATLFDEYSDGWGGDIDGLDVEEWGLASGLLVRVEMDANADESERCGNCDGDCEYCNRFSPALKAARAALTPKEKT